MKVLYLVLAALLFVFTTGAASAHDEETHYDRVHLSASASTEVDNDTVIVNLYAEAEGSDVSKLSNDVNTRIRWGLDLANKQAGIKTQTQAYTTSPVYRNNKVWGWRVRQNIRLESKDMLGMSELLGDLQQKLALSGMQFAISAQRKDEVDDALIKQALSSFESRARMVSEQLGRKGYRIVDINIATSGRPLRHRQYAARVMEMDAVASPAVEGGEQTVTVTVSAEIELE